MKTDRQQKALEIIWDYWDKKGSYPSNLDMASLLVLQRKVAHEV